MKKNWCSCLGGAANAVVNNDTNNNTPADKTDEVSMTLKQLFEENNSLFDMTAEVHGILRISKSTTDQKRRLSCSGKYSEGTNTSASNDDDGETPAAGPRKRSLEDSQGENDCSKKANVQSNNENNINTNSSDSTKDNKNGTKPSFVMAKWAPEDFFNFLKKANSDMERKIRRSTNSNLDLKYGLSRYKTKFESMESQEITNEGTLDSSINKRLNGSRYFSISGCDIYIGQKSLCTNPDKFLKNTGTDHSVDMIFCSTTQADQKFPAVVPWENKVSWNYPGGTLTSKIHDFACLGRDVKLHDLVDENKSVRSLADNNNDETTNNSLEGRHHIDNPTQGEDELKIDGTPYVDNTQTEDNMDSAQTATAGTSSTIGNVNVPQGCGEYKMKHDKFPVRQIVSYMLSFKSRYGILSTGYRFDFIKLEVVNKGEENEQLKVSIAGPLWSVGALNKWILYENASTISKSSYYHNIHRYDEEDSNKVVSILDDTWSTDIGEYSFLEGLMRFMFAAAGMDEDESSRLTQGGNALKSDGISSTNTLNQQEHVPRSHMNDDELPTWHQDYTKKRSSKNRPPYSENQTNAKETNAAYCDLCKGSDPFYFKDKEEKKIFLSQFNQDGRKEDENGYILPSSSKGSSTSCTNTSNVPVAEMTESLHNELPILTKFGHLTLAELEEHQHETKRIGYGRIGEAIMTKLPDVTIAYKLLRRSEWEEEEDYEKRMAELKDEASIYEMLKQHQGSIIPRFLYAGSIVDASYWIIPEHGEMIAFATTYEGESLASCHAKGSLVLTENHHDSVKEGLKGLHDSGVVHSDLNLRNLVFDKNTNDDNCIKFIDFGNAFKKEDYISKDNWDKACQKDFEMLDNVLKSFPLQSTDVLPESSKEFVVEKHECAPV